MLYPPFGSTSSVPHIFQKINYRMHPCSGTSKLGMSVIKLCCLYPCVLCFLLHVVYILFRNQYKKRHVNLLQDQPAVPIEVFSTSVASVLRQVCTVNLGESGALGQRIWNGKKFKHNPERLYLQSIRLYFCLSDHD